MIRNSNNDGGSSERGRNDSPRCEYSASKHQIVSWLTAYCYPVETAEYHWFLPCQNHVDARLILQQNQQPITQLIVLKILTLLRGNKYPYVWVWRVVWCNSGIAGKMSDAETEGPEVHIPFHIVTDDGEGCCTRWVMSGNYVQLLNIWRRGRSDDL